MVKFTGVFDNGFASPMTPLDFVKEYYLTEMGRRELVDSSIKQESAFAALKNDESAQHNLQQLKAEIAAFVHTVVANQGECLQQNVDNFIERMRQLSAV